MDKRFLWRTNRSAIDISEINWRLYVCISIHIYMCAYTYIYEPMHRYLDATVVVERFLMFPTRAVACCRRCCCCCRWLLWFVTCASVDCFCVLDVLPCSSYVRSDVHIHIHMGACIDIEAHTHIREIHANMHVVIYKWVMWMCLCIIICKYWWLSCIIT